MRSRFAVAYLAALALAVFAGCGKDSGQDAAPVSRAEDPVYLKVLESQQKERRNLMKDLDDARKALAAAKAAGAEEGELKKLEEKLEAATAAIKANREKSQAIVAERINRELDEKKNFKKGNR